MGNNFFQFKQFRINQDGAAMKVSTEGCLIGAIATCGGDASVLDIGSGTGLLALMIAQRTNGKITSVEADGEAAAQALRNVESSPWRERVNIVNTTIQVFAEEAPECFDMIVSNPPFYTNYVPSDDVRRKLAMHTYSLSMKDLAAVVGKLLMPEGRFYVIYPAYEAGLFAQTAKLQGLHPLENHIIRNKEGGSIFRMITCYAKTEAKTTQSELVIRDDSNAYTAAFKKLLAPYYLNL
ncbi:MAG: methyltransferase [Imperialibacter sp.]|uniref:tRNA1(Val) (adenine(37)-N6)-methyltransferase n=1 Tax=Imperialibacter sp. TaxID=2038411 RepID=UPI0032F00C32